MIKYTKKVQKELIKMVNPVKSGLTYTTYWRILNGEYVDMKMVLRLMDMFGYDDINEAIVYEKD